MVNSHLPLALPNVGQPWLPLEYKLHRFAMPLKIGVELAGLGIPAKQALRAAADLGVDAVEIDGRGEFAPRNLSETGLRQLRKILADLRLRVASVSFRTRRGYDTPADLDARVEATKAAMQLAAQLGARTVVNHVGRVSSRHDEFDDSLLIEVLTDLAHYGNHVGAFLAAETGSESGEDLAHLFDRLPEGTIGVDLNPGNLAAGGFSPTEAIEGTWNTDPSRPCDGRLLRPGNASRGAGAFGNRNDRFPCPIRHAGGARVPGLLHDSAPWS